MKELDADKNYCVVLQRWRCAEREDAESAVQKMEKKMQDEQRKILISSGMRREVCACTGRQHARRKDNKTNTHNERDNEGRENQHRDVNID